MTQAVYFCCFLSEVDLLSHCIQIPDKLPRELRPGLGTNRRYSPVFYSVLHVSLVRTLNARIRHFT